MLTIEVYKSATMLDKGITIIWETKKVFYIGAFTKFFGEVFPLR